MEDLAQWYYFRQSKRLGPIMAEELQALFDTGQLPGDALIRTTDERAEWRPAFQVGVFQTPAVVSRPRPPSAPWIESTWPPEAEAEREETSGPQKRPWIRYWARMFDLTTFSLGFGLLLGIVMPVPLAGDSGTDLLLALSIFFCWIVAEALLLCTLGTTPGKWFLNIRIRNSNGAKPGFLQAFSRGLWVWVAGFGLGLPLINLITFLMSYSRLMNRGETYWDEKAECVVQHRYIPAWKGLLFVFCLLAVPMIILMALLGAVMMEVLSNA